MVIIKAGTAALLIMGTAFSGGTHVAPQGTDFAPTATHSSVTVGPVR